MEGAKLVLDLRVQKIEAAPKASPEELEESRLNLAEQRISQGTRGEYMPH
jgi:hypothetical protein